MFTVAVDGANAVVAGTDSDGGYIDKRPEEIVIKHDEFISITTLF